MEKRTNRGETAHLPIQPDLFPAGVGGRQGDTHLATGGGGYLETCTGFKLGPSGAEKSRDPRLDDLRAMGLHWAWLAVAETIGVDAFLATWRVLDGVEQFQDSSGQLAFALRRYKSFTRHQRNQFVRQLAIVGTPITEIQQRIDKQLGESLTPRTIQRIIRGEIK